MTIETLLILIPALPLVGALLSAALGPRVLRRQSHWPVVVAVVASFLASVVLAFQVQRDVEKLPTDSQGFERVVTLWRWADLRMPPSDASLQPDHSPSGEGTSFRVDVVLRADPLSAVMLTIVTCISALVAVYSVGYMHGDRGYWRFFAYFGLFVFSMTMLVAASNLVVMFVFWELVGLCSYLLIGFWYEKPAAAASGMKAFLVNRVGDAGFLLAMFLIWTFFGTFHLHSTWSDGTLVQRGVIDQAMTSLGAAKTLGSHSAPIAAICCLLMWAACGKSAQFPLHVWLPDAMEGPTPVSALIHAATMVTAGVYLVARCLPLFAACRVTDLVALVGGGTALLAAVIALTQNDLKRILAYSTISHLGYMFLALGTGTLAGLTAAMFHLATHAFFKALLFLGAGSVMHATGGVTDIRRLGGLRRRLPVTYLTFLIGCLAIAGVWPLSGFFSKDAILQVVLNRSASGEDAELYRTLFATAMFGVLLIDFYMFRPFFLVFHGAEKLPPEADGRVQESPGVMTVPLMILAFGSVAIGAYFEWTAGLARFLAAMPLPSRWRELHAGELAASVQTVPLGRISAAVTLVGIALAAAVFLGRRSKAAGLARLMNVFGLYSLSYGKFFIDPIYQWLIVRPVRGVAWLAALLDRWAIDELVDVVGWTPKWLGAALRPIQNGLTPFYALAMMVGVLVLIVMLLM
ncbi:MAG: NADH-quinone oxidoreductase subunit L [Thermoguttaceae bacterium]